MDVHELKVEASGTIHPPLLDRVVKNARSRLQFCPVARPPHGLDF
ncbi:MAG: hypothetical protein QXX87_06155 [Candidatus Jordarchaeales archaeon]